MPLRLPQLFSRLGQRLGQWTIQEPQRRKDLEHFYSKSLIHMVGVKGFEPSTPCTPCKCATRLRHTPSAFYYSLKFRRSSGPDSDHIEVVQACHAMFVDTAFTRLAKIRSELHIGRGMNSICTININEFIKD